MEKYAPRQNRDIVGSSLKFNAFVRQKTASLFSNSPSIQTECNKEQLRANQDAFKGWLTVSLKHKNPGGGPGSCEEEREMFVSRDQRRVVALTCWHRKARRLRPVSIMMTVSKAVTVAIRNISMPLG